MSEKYLRERITRVTTRWLQGLNRPNLPGPIHRPRLTLPPYLPPPLSKLLPAPEFVEFPHLDVPSARADEVADFGGDVDGVVCVHVWIVRGAEHMRGFAFGHIWRDPFRDGEDEGVGAVGYHC